MMPRSGVLLLALASLVVRPEAAAAGNRLPGSRFVRGGRGGAPVDSSKLRIGLGPVNASRGPWLEFHIAGNGEVSLGANSGVRPARNGYLLGSHLLLLSRVREEDESGVAIELHATPLISARLMVANGLPITTVLLGVEKRMKFAPPTQPSPPRQFVAEQTGLIDLDERQLLEAHIPTDMEQTYQLDREHRWSADDLPWSTRIGGVRVADAPARRHIAYHGSARTDRRVRIERWLVAGRPISVAVGYSIFQLLGAGLRRAPSRVRLRETITFSFQD
jgi:hypothetical protein